VHQESWPFGGGWTLKKFVFEMTEPRYMPLIGYPEAWTPSTKGELNATPVYIGDLADTAAVRAQSARLQGAIVLSTQAQDRFIISDRVEPSLSDTNVRSGAPAFLNPRGPIAGRGAAAILNGAGVVLKPTQGQHGTMFVLGNRATRDDAAPAVVLLDDGSLCRLRHAGPCLGEAMD